MDKRFANAIASIIAAGGGISAHLAAEATPFHEMTTMEQATHVVTDVGEAADDASSADDVTKKAETVDDQLTSKADARPSPEANPEGDDPQKILLDLEGNQEEEKREKADKDVALGDHEEVSSGNITDPAPPAVGESAVTGEEQAQDAAPADEEQSRAVAEADQERAGSIVEDQRQAEASQHSASATAEDQDPGQSQAAAAAEDREPGQHWASATAEDQDPGQSQAAATTEPDVWLEDDADVHDPDID
jgi:hypothetical protein